MANSRYTSAAHEIAVKNMQDTDAANRELYSALTRQAMAGRQHQEDLKLQGQQKLDASAQQDQQKVNALNMIEQKAKENPDYDYAVETAKVTKHRPEKGIDPLRQQALDLRKQGLEDRESQALSKQYDHTSGFLSTIKDLDNLTNRDGQGGVMTNPNAKLVSAGKVSSGVPTGALGIGELLGVTPKGTTEERKAIERLRLEYGKATAGMRQSDALRSQEAAAMGMISSGDPDLTAKGVRALARQVQMGVSATQAGYRPEVLDRVHKSFGNPMDELSHVYDDSPHKQVTQNQPPAPQGAQDPLQALLGGKGATAAPQQPQVSPDDQKAMSWLQANPQHPSAPAVAGKLKAKGLMQ